MLASSLTLNCRSYFIRCGRKNDMRLQNELTTAWPPDRLVTHAPVLGCFDLVTAAGGDLPRPQRSTDATVAQFYTAPNQPSSGSITASISPVLSHCERPTLSPPGCTCSPQLSPAKVQIFIKYSTYNKTKNSERNFLFTNTIQKKEACCNDVTVSSKTSLWKCCYFKYICLKIRTSLLSTRRINRTSSQTSWSVSLLCKKTQKKTMALFCNNLFCPG